MSDMHVVLLTNQKDYVLFSCTIHLAAGLKFISWRWKPFKHFWSSGIDVLSLGLLLTNLALLPKAANHLSEAEQMYRQALKILEDSLGPDHPDTITVRNNIQNLK